MNGCLKFLSMVVLLSPFSVFGSGYDGVPTQQNHKTKGVLQNNKVSTVAEFSRKAALEILRVVPSAVCGASAFYTLAYLISPKNKIAEHLTTAAFGAALSALSFESVYLAAKKGRACAAGVASLIPVVSVVSLFVR